MVGLQAWDRLNRDERILNDKWKHCVVGFEIALAVGLPVAQNAAWNKEKEDISDGRLESTLTKTTTRPRWMGPARLPGGRTPATN